MYQINFFYNAFNELESMQMQQLPQKICELDRIGFLGIILEFKAPSNAPQYKVLFG